VSQTPAITPEQLQVGMYVHLDMKWFDHPFAFSHFKISNQEQIKTIRSLGLKALRYSPELSNPDIQLSAIVAALPAEAAEAVVVPAEPSAAMLAKRAMMAQMQQRREDAERIEKAFVNTAQTVRDIEKNLYSHPAETLQAANKLVQSIADSILSAPELAIQVMGDKLGGEELYFHSLNVTMLSMMMARDMKLPVEVVAVLGVGAFALKGVLIPWVLLRALRQMRLRRESGPLIGYIPTMVLGALITSAAFIFADFLPLRPEHRGGLFIPTSLATLFVGFLLLMTRRDAVSQVLGYLVLENGIYLFGLTLADRLPLLVEMGVLLDVFVAVFVMGVAIYHIRREFDHMDVDQLDTLKG